VTERAGGVDGPGDLIFLEPVYLTKVWGGSRLREMYGTGVPAGRIGECLAISARPEGDCLVKSGPFAGMALSALWAQHRELFGGTCGDAFPLQIKVLDASDDLSIQVHPDAAYSARHEHEAGKNECWYVMCPATSGRIIIGHQARSREEFARSARAGRWTELLRTVEMREGDFFFIPAGTVHAILAGSLIYEVQQPSCLTYRLYDYDRLDDGQPRELHVEKALDVVEAPSEPAAAAGTVSLVRGATRTAYPRNEYFSVSRWQVSGSASIPVEAPFLLVSVLSGRGEIDGCEVAGGAHFIVPAGVATLQVSGEMTLMASSI
jgi:mannose-6-phosphate isomerase